MGLTDECCMVGESLYIVIVMYVFATSREHALYDPYHIWLIVLKLKFEVSKP